MLYLEDYLEMIENLPMEMRDKFTEMREMDLQVQNAMDSLSDRVKTFFKKCGSTPPAKADWKKEQFDQIKEEYQKALEDADEKVQLANQIYELVERYLRKLDQEVSKFKMELEADNAGITEILEKRSLELDKPLHVNNHRAEKRKYSAITNHLDSGQPRGKVHSSLAPDSAKDSGGSNKTSSASASPATNMFNSGSTPSSSYNIGHVGPGCPAAIAVAASRAIGATLEMQQGRRTSSMKASYEAVNRGADLTKEFQFGRDLASTPPVPETKTTARNKKASARQQQQQQQQQQPASAPATPAPPPEAPPATTEDTPVETPAEESTSWQYDPKEPRYCLCNDVSYGDMVACDNEDCPIEWFHYGCVGLNQAPKGKWYCPQCIAAMRRRGRK